jgi:hypothetical protein
MSAFGEKLEAGFAKARKAVVIPMPVMTQRTKVSTVN